MALLHGHAHTLPCCLSHVGLVAQHQVQACAGCADSLAYPAGPPKVLHYGLIYTIANTNYTFDKHWHYDFDATACPPWDMTTDHPKKGLFPHPPRASSFTTKASHCSAVLPSDCHHQSNFTSCG